MKQNVSVSQFRDAFSNMDRYGHFSYKGYSALFDWFEQYDEDSDSETELDVIAICCDFTEYASFDEFKADYDNDMETIEDLNDETMVIPIPGTDRFIIQNY